MCFVSAETKEPYHVKMLQLHGKNNKTNLFHVCHLDSFCFLAIGAVRNQISSNAFKFPVFAFIVIMFLLLRIV